MWIKYPRPPRLSWAFLFYRRYQKQFATLLWAPSSEAVIPLTQQTASYGQTSQTARASSYTVGWSIQKKKTKNKKTQTKTEEKHNAVHHPSHGNQRKAKKNPKQNKTSHPSLWILCGDWGQLYYGSINCLIYLHYNTQVTLARHLLPGYVSENTIDVQQHVYIWHPPPWRRGDMGERCIKHRRGSSIGAAKPTHRQCIFQGGTAKDGNRSTTKSLAKSQMAHLWNRPLPPSTSFLESTFYFHGRSPPSTFLDTLEVRSQKGDAGPFHHPSDAQNAQGQQPEG